MIRDTFAAEILQHRLNGSWNYLRTRFVKTVAKRLVLIAGCIATEVMHPSTAAIV
jgi:hypothetical protein